MKKTIHVLGAGIVGICSAIELLRRGYRVVLVDRKEPARETSFGNAGVLAEGSITPEASPEIWARLPEFLLNRGTEAHLHYRQLPRMLPYLWRFMANCRESTYHRNTAPLNAILNRAVETHRVLIDECGAGDLLRERGWLKIYRSAAAFEKSRADEALLEEHGVPFARLGPGELAELEPDLSRNLVGARWMTGVATITNPGELGLRYAELFRRRGGLIERRRVRSLSPRSTGWKIVCDGGDLDAERVLVTMGAWSRELLAPLGYRIPLIAERGYHQHFVPEGGASLRRPIHDIEAGYVLAPMEMGHRLTTGAEWATLDSPPTPVQLARVTPLAREIFPLGREDGETWLGNRPQTPDTLPAIGPVPGHDNLWLATGHGHLGLSLGPVTGMLIAQSVEGAASDIDMTPYRPDRF